MKALLISLTLLISNLASFTAHAGCTPPAVAVSAVAGRTYELQNSPNPEYPIHLTFGSTRELTAGYGSAVDGHPGGDYHFRGNCHGEVIVTFTSHFEANPKPKIVLQLRPQDPEYFYLKSVNDSNTVFKIVID